MSEFLEVGELESEARRLLHYRIPLILAVVVNFFLLARMPYARTHVEPPAPTSSTTATADVATASALLSPPMLYAISREIEAPATDAAQTTPAQPTPEIAQANEPEVAPPRMEAAAHGSAALVPQHLLRSLTWQPQPGVVSDGSAGTSAAPRTELTVVREPSAPAVPAPAATDMPAPSPALPTHTNAPTPGLTLRNAHENRGPVSFLVNGRVCELLPGEAHEFTAGQSWEIRFHRGDTLGDQHRTLTRGVYRFVVTDQGWDLEDVTY